MSQITIDYLRREEAQPLTQAQVEEVKQATATRPKANVNIVPYEIYDEDGEEIVVGEVRKTIDGVKKKKPVYKIIVTKDSVSNNSLIIDLSDYDVEKMIDYYGTISNAGYSYAFPYCDASGYDCHAMILQSTNAMTCVVKKFTGTTPLTMSIRYTKTTDTWEEV